MALPIKVEDQSKIPEGSTALYVEQSDGSYLLDVEGVDNHPDVHGLKSSLQRQKDDREKLRKERDLAISRSKIIPENMTAEELQDAIDRINEDKDKDDKDDKDKDKTKVVDVAKLRQQLEKKHKEEIDERDGKLSKSIKTIRSLIVETALSSALIKAKVTVPSFQKAAKKLLESDVKIRDDEDGNPVPYVDSDMGEITVAQFVMDWTSGEEGSPFVDGNRGSGAGGGKNPKGSKSLTRAQFDELDPSQKSDFTKNGGKVHD